MEMKQSHRYTPYPANKSSGIEWLGEIPAHWKALTLRRGIAFLTDFEANGSFSSIKDNVNVDGSENFAWYVRATDLENLRDEYDSESRYVDEASYNYLAKTKLYGGELLITKRGEIGKLYVMPQITKPSTLAPNLYLVRLNSRLFPKFTYYWFRSSYGQPQLFLADKSTTIGALYKNDVRECVTLFPPLPEQQAIADFLDHHTARIDALIEKQQRLIALLHEKRTALISHAVTKGLDPTVPMKDSGVEWLGEIPAHWEVTQLFSLAREKQVKNSGGQEQNVLSLSYGNIVRRDVESNFGLLPESFNTYQIIEADDIILRLTDLQNDKRSLRVGKVRERGIITSAYVCLRLITRLIPEYFYQLLHTYDVNKVFYALGGGVRQTMRFADLKHMPVLVPPEEEQKQILKHIKTESDKILTLVAKMEKLIKLLEEKRTALISAAVTGKIDVRRWQGEL
jgi:type I restriction enzyme, S subunit